MKKAFLIAPILACSLALAVSINTRVEVVNADDSGSTTMTLQAVLKSVWNGNGEADFGSFKAYVGHGTLSTSDAPGYAAMTKSDSSEGDFNGSGASVDWGGQRLITDDDDRVQIKFRLSKGMTINVSGLENPEGWMGEDGCQINYFAVYGGDIKNGNWYTALKTVSMFVGTTVSTDIDYQTTLNGGDTFVLEWGYQYKSSRNWSNAGTGVQFSFTPAASIKTLYYSDMVSAVSSAGDDVITDAPFASYGFYHGNLRNHSIEKMTSDAENHLVGDYVQTYHYGATFNNNDSLIIKIVASEHMVLNIQRLEKGTEWLAGCYLRYWVNTTEVMTQEFDSEPDASVFNTYIVLNTNDVFYMEVGFQWDEKPRSMNMLNGGDIKTSLPQFNGYGTANSEFLTNAKDASTTVASAIVCYGGTQNPTLDGYTWDQLGDLYNGLDEKAKALMSQGTYTIENGSAFATNGTSQEVANAVAKYDQLVVKYSYSDFMGRNPQIDTGLNLVSMKGDSSSTTTISIIVVVCVTSITLVGICLIRKRKLVK